MTSLCRALVLGILAALFICGYCHFNDHVVRQGRLVPHLMPIIVYGGLLLVLLCINPLLARLRRHLSGRELAVVVALALVACSIPSYGLVKCLPTSIMLPFHYERLRPGWAQAEATSFPPQRMLPDTSGDEERIVKGYIMGLGEGDAHIGLTDIPWGAWARPLLFWLPLLLSITLATLGLAVVCHRQWSRHEQLPYPITRFARALMPDGDASRGAVFRDRLFWIGFLLVFAIALNNYLCRWWPHLLIPVRTYLDFTAFSSLTPTLVAGHGTRLLRPRLLFSVIGLSYFLSSDVSFSMAFGPFIFCTIAGILSRYGVVLRTGHHQSVKLEAFLFTGGYTGIALMMFYTGRHFYRQVLERALCIRRSAAVRPYEMWAMRLFLAGTVAFIAQLALVGLDWQLATLYTILALIIFIAVSRTIAETGAFYIGTEVFPGAIIWGFMGTVALGPSTMIVMFLVTVVLLVGPGWAPMPFIVQALQMSDTADVDVGRTARWAVVVLLVGTAVAVPAVLYWQYDRGALAASGGWPQYAATFPFENMVEITHRLEAQGTLELAESLHGWRRFVHLQPHWPAVTAFILALVMSVLIATARLRFVHWPFHPVMFVFLGGAQALTMSGSFMIGWIIKSLVSKYGGERAYQALKPFMIGVIAGDVLGQLLPQIVGTVYYLITGHQP